MIVVQPYTRFLSVSAIKIFQPCEIVYLILNNIEPRNSNFCMSVYPSQIWFWSAPKTDLGQSKSNLSPSLGRGCLKARTRWHPFQMHTSFVYIRTTFQYILGKRSHSTSCTWYISCSWLYIYTVSNLLVSFIQDPWASNVFIVCVCVDRDGLMSKGETCIYGSLHLWKYTGL